jgi:hypothetical protein
MDENKSTKKTKTEAEPPKSQGGAVTFPTEKLLNCDEFKKYHPAFVRALLPNATYSREEARKIIANYFKGGNK